MTPKQERFVDEYLVDLNASQAAIRAGYSRRTARAIASENLAKPNIQEAIAEAKRERSEATKIDAEWVLRQAVELHLRCMQEIKPAIHPKTRRHLRDDSGNALYTFNAAAANRALALIGKHVDVNAFRENIQVNHDIDLVERIRNARNRATMKRVQDAEAA